MTDIAASDLTYDFKMRDKEYLGGRLGYLCRGTISGGNGSLTYPTGGIPLLKGKLGLPRVIKSLKVLETNARGYVFEYDVSAEKLKLFIRGALAPTANLASNAVAVVAPTISFASAGGNVADDRVVGIAALSNNTSLVANTVVVGVTGVQATTGTVSNSVVSVDAITAAALSEATGGSFAPASFVLEVEAIGY